MRFHELPVDIFGMSAQPYVKRLNSELRQLFSLEGTLGTALDTGGGDGSIKRKNVVTVDSSRVTPPIDATFAGLGTSATFICVTNETALTNERRLVVSQPLVRTDAGANSTLTIGISAGGFGTTLSAIPTIGFSSVYAAGSASTLVRTDATLKAPSLLLSTPTEVVMSLSDDAVSTLQLNGTSGFTVLGFSFAQLTLTAPANAATSRLQVNIDPDFNNVGIQSAWAGGEFEGASYASWDAKMGGPGSGVSDATVCGFDTSTLSLNPTGVISSGLNYFYGIRCLPVIANNGASFTDAAAGYFRGVRRSFVSPFIAYQAGIIVEPPTAGTSAQFGILIRQQTAQATGSNRYGIYIDSQNSGTNRWSIYGVSDRAQFTGPLVVDGSLGVTGRATFGNSVTVNGNFFHGLTYSNIVALYGAAGATQSSGWSASGFTDLRILNGSSFTLNDVMSTLNTLITHLVLRGDLLGSTT